ncbi:MAG: hypothetical protein V2I33_19515 [Kangiellaceae bacterium]|nr:hypothetical protein [Kangiellaceae bacterium]
MITELLVNILDKAGNYLAKVFRRDLIELFAGNEFFGMMDNSKVCLKNWTRVANRVIAFCYPDKNAIINEFLNRVPTGVFVSKANELLHRKKALVCISFMIYSGEVNDFQSCV